MSTLQKAMEEKKDARKRQAALFAYGAHDVLRRRGPQLAEES